MAACSYHKLPLLTCLFILFGLWTIRGDKLEGEILIQSVLDRSDCVFIIEMGDKTQLATVALAVKYQRFVPVWLGTTIGMVIADAFGIIVGIVLGKRIPERFVKWGSAVVCMAVGVYGIHENVSEEILTLVVEIASLAVLVAVVYFVARAAAPRETGTSDIRE